MVERVDAPVRDGAQMHPAVPEVEFVDELLAGSKPAEGEPPPVEQVVVVLVLPVRTTDPLCPVGEQELVQVAPVPARKCVVDRVGELSEGVGPGGREDAARAGPVVVTVPFNKIYPYRQPGSANGPILSADGGLRRLGRALPRADLGTGPKAGHARVSPYWSPADRRRPTALRARTDGASRDRESAGEPCPGHRRRRRGCDRPP